MVSVPSSRDEGGERMLGIEDPYIWTGYLTAIAVALVCVIYGLLKWNEDGEDDG